MDKENHGKASAILLSAGCTLVALGVSFIQTTQMLNGIVAVILGLALICIKEAFLDAQKKEY